MFFCGEVERDQGIQRFEVVAIELERTGEDAGRVGAVALQSGEDAGLRLHGGMVGDTAAINTCSAPSARRTSRLAIRPRTSAICASGLRGSVLERLLGKLDGAVGTTAGQLEP